MTLDANPKLPDCRYCFPSAVEATNSVFGIFTCDKPAHIDAALSEHIRKVLHDMSPSIEDINLPEPPDET